jgi:hypothetical protein
LKWYDGGGRKWNHIKMIFEVEVFFSSQNIGFPFYLRRLMKLFFFFLFLFFFFFYAPSLEDLRVLMIFKEKITSSKTFFKWHDMECMIMTMDILAVDTYFRMELCMPI